MDRQDEIISAIDSLTSMLEIYTKEQDEVKQEVSELHKVLEKHNKILVKLLDTKILKEDEEEILNKLRYVEKKVKENRLLSAIYAIATLIGFYYTVTRF